MISATPSGGWLQSSPVIPALGWPLGTRAQMFWLEEGLPSSLQPGRAPADDALSRPRAPATGGRTSRGERPGGDQQEQWALHAFVRHVDLGLDLQAAIDAPEFHTDHLISSFYPRGFAPRSLALESRVRVADGRGAPAARPRRDALRRRGRSAASPRSRREPDGLLKAGANPRGMQGYAVGRCPTASARARTRWDDPFALRDAMAGRSGLELMQLMASGELPPPPIANTLDFRLVEADAGTAVFECEPAEFHYNPIGIVHAGLAMTLMDSAMGLRVRDHPRGARRLDDARGEVQLHARAHRRHGRRALHRHA